MSRTISAVLFTVATLLSSNVIAFDSERNGFLIGLGLGVSNSSITVKYYGNSDIANRETSDTNPYYSFRIGGGIGRKATLYFLANRNRDSEIEYGFTGLGATYYFKETSQSFYLNAGIGLGTVTNDEFLVSDGSGEAFMIGAGFEPIRGLHLELNLLSINADDDVAFSFLSNADYDVFATQLMIGYIWF